MFVVRRICGVSVAALAAVTLATGVTAAGAQDNKKKDKPDAAAQAQAQAQQQEIQALVRLADAAMAGQTATSDFAMQFQNDFIKAQQGRVWVPVILTIDPSKLTNPAGEPAAVYVRAAPRGMTAPPSAQAQQDKDKKDKKKKDKNAPPDAKGMPSPYPFEDVSYNIELKPSAPGQPIRVLRGIGVPPGSYDLYIVLKEHPAQPGAAVKTSILKQPLDVPNFNGNELATSSIILAQKVDQLPTALPADQQTEHPYTFGQTQIVISPDHKFTKADELIVLMQIYNPSVSPDKKFDIEATYTFFKTGPNGETRFNATEPQSFTPEKMGPGFDPSSPDRSIQAGQGIPLLSFPEGNYRLEIKITDKLSSKVLTQSVSFSVAP
jgi:hypothetical protein